MTWNALLDPMITFYRETLERTKRILKATQIAYKACKKELQELRLSYDRLEEWAESQEQRADALQTVIETFVNQNGRQVRRDLLDAFNEVATDLGIELGDFDSDESDFSVEDIDV